MTLFLVFFDSIMFFVYTQRATVAWIMSPVLVKGSISLFLHPTSAQKLILLPFSTSRRCVRFFGPLRVQMRERQRSQRSTVGKHTYRIEKKIQVSSPSKMYWYSSLVLITFPPLDFLLRLGK